MSFEQFEFRTILKSEAEQAVTIEHICFPPNEACSRQAMLTRIENASEQFLVAVDKTTGKLAGFINGFCWGIVALCMSILGAVAQKFGIMNVLVLLSIVPAVSSYYVRFLKEKS